MTPSAIGRDVIVDEPVPAARDTSAAVCVHQHIAAIAAQIPDAIAVTVDADHFTYAALHRAAGALAARLRRAGVDLEARVAVALDRSFDLVVALLGTLDAGGAYVPIDPNIGPERFAALLRDAGARCLVTAAALRPRLPALALPICLADDPAPTDLAPARSSRTLPRASAPDGDTLAYVLYTSGTTGEPKGVAVSHAALHNLLTSMQRAPGLTAADALLAVTPITFDIAALEIWLPLITGARLVLAPPHSAADGPDLRARLAREHISVLQATPATWHLLLDAGWEAPDGFKVLCGGEPLPPELARRLLATAGHVWNCYGPTETTIWSTLDRLDAADGPITIGHPIAHTSVYVLDGRLEPVAHGSAGELCIGGIGVARGYLGRPDLTARSFVPDPFGAIAGQRMYRTGDLARYAPDGRLECLGRIDHQIKLRGYRIEPGAIESVLGKHPQISRAVVLAWDRAPGDRHLVAYVAVANGDRIDPAAVKAFVRERLPEYMVPSILMQLPHLPLSANGKIDRRALPSPERWRPDTGGSYVPPVGGREETIASVWRRVLRVERVGLHDNFFDLGGNSLLFAQAHAELSSALDREISIVDVYQYPTIGLLSAYLSGSGAEPARAAAPASRADRQRRALAQLHVRRQRPATGRRM